MSRLKEMQLGLRAPLVDDLGHGASDEGHREAAVLVPAEGER